MSAQTTERERELGERGERHRQGVRVKRARPGGNEFAQAVELLATNEGGRREGKE